MLAPHENENFLERSDRGSRSKQSAGSSAVFTRVLLLVSVLMFGIIIGMKISDYFHGAKLAGNGGGAQPLVETVNDPGLPAIASSTGAVDPTGTTIQGTMVPPTIPGQLPSTTPQDSLANLNYSGGNRTEAQMQQNWQDLQALDEERRLLNQRYESVMSGASAPGPQFPGSPNPYATTSNPGMANSAVPSSNPASAPAANTSRQPLLPPGGNSEPLMPPTSGPKKEGLTASEKRVRDAPALAQITEFNPDYQFIVINGGERRNLSVNSKLAVRRGHEVLGLVEVDEVFEDESSANLIGNWALDRKMPRPQEGDDVIQYPLF